MKLVLLCLLITIPTFVVCQAKDDFSEFDAPEDFSEPEPQTVAPTAIPNVAEPQAPKVEVVFDEDEFSTLDDDEEADTAPAIEKETAKLNTQPEQKMKPLTFADIPTHFRLNWSSYQVESLALAVIFIYTLNFIYGRSRNQSLAQQWYDHSKAQLEAQYALVGDDGTSQEPKGGHLNRETESAYTLWCTGRAGVQGLHAQLKLLKRQDILGLALNQLSPRRDRAIYRFDLDVGEMDPFVFVYGARKTVTKMAKEYTDLASYATERRNVTQYGLPSTFVVYAEVPECINNLVDQYTLAFIKQHEQLFDYVHYSDQYCGQKAPDETISKLPDATPTLTISLLLPSDGDLEQFQTKVISFLHHTLNRLFNFHLSREGKAKADKNRRTVEELLLKNTHQQRQEAAQARREEKTRERKQRILDEDDPDKQRRLQKLEDKKDKTKQPKVKQLRVK